MALTYDDLTGKTNKHIVPRMVDEVYKSSPLFTRLRSRNMERFEGGQTIRHPIMYAKLKGGAFTRGGSFDTSYVQTDTALEVNVKYLKSSLQVWMVTAYTAIRLACEKVPYAFGHCVRSGVFGL